ncbi:MAG TPA: radical SAM protein [Ktedonobacteraceae bacterium]
MRKRIVFTVEKKRVLVPVGMPCPFGCRYCYTRGKDVRISRDTPEEIIADFQEFARETTTPFETVQFGYDSDPFSRPERGLPMLRQLAKMRKHINFSTKALLEGQIIDELSEIHQEMVAADMTLSALISLSCWDSALLVEPHTPLPSERMLSIVNLKRIGLPVFIAVRPILPHIPDSEYERLAEEGVRAGCDGFILGPLYADAAKKFVRFIPPALLATIPGTTGSVSWSPHQPIWTRYEDPERLQRMLAMIESKGGRTFLSSADAMDRVAQKEPVA